MRWSYLFVYGTLRSQAPQEQGRAMRTELQGVGRCLGLAHWQAQLYQVSFYPAAIGSENPSDQVIGELYEIAESALPPLLAKLDIFEECSMSDLRPHEYDRIVSTVHLLETQESYTAHIYEYAKDVKNLKRIQSGDFLNP
ncbi:MAG: gamma-glutamylcyclotransferase [Burkholderiaceae bacterium]|nr:gamma-glutamylcyclotransferase [Burkholderiaceae bacterium]